jgi:DNA-binding MarR family transcriptional regulator
MWRAYLRMHADLERVMGRQLTADSNLSAADWALLVPLSESPSERLRARDLGLTTGWDRSRLSHHIRRMEQRGLVERTNCPTDGRGTFVHLTEAGLLAVKATAPGHVDTVRRSFIDLLSPAEVETLRDIGERVSAQIRSEGDCAGAEDCSEEN